MKTDDFEIGAFFTTNGRDIWKLQSFCTQPTCKLKNLETGEEVSFGIGGLTSENYHKITMPDEALKKESINVSEPKPPQTVDVSESDITPEYRD